MDREEILKNFIKTLTVTVKLNNYIDDKFFGDKLNIKITNLTYHFINYLTVSEDNLAQYNLFFYKLMATTDSLIELIQDMIYLKLLEPSPLFFEAKKYLLSTKLDAIKNKKLFFNKDIRENKKDVFEKTTTSTKISEKTIKLNSSKQKILNFIKSYPNIRTRDIINEFNVLSDRTVKRNLTELLKTGIIKKRIDNKATHYSHVDS